MSLYNFLMGENEDAPVLLGVLGLNKEAFGRFRDIYLNADGTEIIVYTRCGGGNRKDYQYVFKKMKERPDYICDYDDDFDCTYAYIKFKVLDKYLDMCKKMATGKEPETVKEKFEKHIEEMDKPGTEAYKKAEEIAKKFNDAASESNGGIHFISF